MFFGRKSKFSAMQWGTKEGECKGLERVQNLALLGSMHDRHSRIHHLDFDVLKDVKQLIFVAQTEGQRKFDLGKEPDLLLFKETEWSQQNLRFLSMCAERELLNMRRLLKEANWRQRSREPGTSDGAEWTAFGDGEYDIEKDYQGLPQVEVRIGTFVKGTGDKWHHRGLDWPF